MRTSLKERQRMKQYALTHHPQIAKQRHRWYVKYKRRIKNRALLKHYGISLAEYEDIFQRQNSKCAICRNAPQGRFCLSVDHNHTTQKIRGLLCGKCNFALGLFQDNSKVLKSAIRYLKRGSV